MSKYHCLVEAGTNISAGVYADVHRAFLRASESSPGLEIYFKVKRPASEDALPSDVPKTHFRRLVERFYSRSSDEKIPCITASASSITQLLNLRIRDHETLDLVIKGQDMPEENLKQYADEVSCILSCSQRRYGR